MTRLHLSAAFAALLSLAHPLAAQDGPLPDGPNVNLVYAKCQQCHPINYVVESAGLPDFLWQDTLSLMQQLGMQVTEEEERKLYDYLTTYLGTEPPPEPSGESAEKVDGSTVYAGSCAVCHGAEGQGTPGTFPPLAGHAAALARADRGYLPLVVLYGLAGEIEIAGETYNAVMPGWRQLSDEEIAAVLNLIGSWGADKESIEPYTGAEIESLRDLRLSAGEVRDRRPGL